jgi:hypothetical protein
LSSGNYLRNATDYTVAIYTFRLVHVFQGICFLFNIETYEYVYLPINTHTSSYIKIPFLPGAGGSCLATLGGRD